MPTITYPPLIIGLTGGIGSGKSLASSFFKNLGIKVIDVDIISHQLTDYYTPAIDRICAQFGHEFIMPNGALNRSKMRKKVFGDTSARIQLEAILHPMITEKVLQEIKESQSLYTLLAVPLLFEQDNLRQLCHRICVIDCPVSLQIERVQKRNQLSQQQILEIIHSQVDRETRLSLADDIIVNDCSEKHLEMQVMQLHQKYLSLLSS